MTELVYANRIVGSGLEPPDQLLANPNNWRTHPAFQQESVLAVLEAVGWVQRVIVNKRTGRLVDGHLRVILSLRRGEHFVPVSYVDLSEEEEALVLATLDPLAALAGTDADVLDSLLSSLGESASTDSLDRLLDALAPTVDGPLPLDLPAGAGDYLDSVSDTALAGGLSHVRMVHLFLTAGTLDAFLAAAETLSERYGTDNLTDTVTEAVARAEARLVLEVTRV